MIIIITEEEIITYVDSMEYELEQIDDMVGLIERVEDYFERELDEDEIELTKSTAKEHWKELKSEMSDEGLEFLESKENYYSQFHFKTN